MSLDRFMVWFDFTWCLLTIGVISYLIYKRKDALDPMRWGRIVVFSGLALIYLAEILNILNPRLSAIVARFYIVPVCIVLGIFPSTFSVKQAKIIKHENVDAATLKYIETALREALIK